VGISLGIDKPAVTIERVAQAIKRGYKRVKVKIDRGREYEISQVRERLVPRHTAQR